jgi:60 kDa SS-A/Ro ribonucleoprotein
MTFLVVSRIVRVISCQGWLRPSAVSNPHYRAYNTFTTTQTFRGSMNAGYHSNRSGIRHHIRGSHPTRERARMSDIYGTVNRRKTTQDRQADPRQVQNSAGGYTFTVAALERAKRFLVLGSSAGSYYSTPGELTLENAEAIVALAESDGLALVDLIVDISVGGKAPRANPALFALAIAASVGTDESKAYALSRLSAVARTGTHLFIFAGYVEQFRGWGRGLRRAVADWYTAKPVDDVAFQAVKYRQREGWSHRDLLRLTHPRTTEPQRKALFDWISGRNADELPRIIAGFEAAQLPGADVPALIREFGLSWEMLPNAALSEVDTWDALLDGGMPQTALLRQLPRLTRLGILDPFGGRTAEISAQLVDRDRLRNARVHPISLLMAMKTYASGVGRGSSWSPVTAIIDALDEAFYAAFRTIEPAGKRTLIGLDISGSMGAAWDPSHVLTAREIGAALSLVITATEPRSDVYGFTADGADYRSGTAFTPLKISKKQRLDDVLRATSGLRFGRTDCALPMVVALKKRWKIDTFVVITDNETWAGSIHPHQALVEYRQKMGIDAKLVVLAVTPTRFSIADPTDAGMLDVVGFSADVPTLVTEFSRGL